MCYAICIARLLKDYVSGVCAANLAAGSVCVCVCVCVCEGQHCAAFSTAFLDIKTAIVVSATLLVACITSDRKKEFCRERQASVAAMLPLYQLEITQRLKRS